MSIPEMVEKSAASPPPSPSKPKAAEKPPTRAQEAQARQESAAMPAKAVDALRSVVVGARGFEVTNGEQLAAFCRAAVSARLVPANVDTVEKAIIMVNHGLAIGLTLAECLSGVYVVNGRAAVYGQTVTRLGLTSGMLEDFTLDYTGEGAEMVAHFTGTRKGWKPKQCDYSMAEARQAGLYPPTTKDGKPSPDSPWNRHTRRMLGWKAVGEWFRVYGSDMLAGVSIMEDLEGETAGRTIDVTSTPLIGGGESDEEPDGLDTILGEPEAGA